MDKQPLSFRPSDNERYWLEQNGIDWSDFCHISLDEKITGKKKETRERIIERMINRCILVFVGFLCLAMSFTALNELVFYSLTAGALVCLSFGVILVVLEVKKYADWRRSNTVHNNTP